VLRRGVEREDISTLDDALYSTRYIDVDNILRHVAGNVTFTSKLWGNDPHHWTLILRGKT
jgi:hypothetical protein